MRKLLVQQSWTWRVLETFYPDVLFDITKYLHLCFTDTFFDTLWIRPWKCSGYFTLFQGDLNMGMIESWPPRIPVNITCGPFSLLPTLVNTRGAGAQSKLMWCWGSLVMYPREKKHCLLRRKLFPWETSFVISLGISSRRWRSLGSRAQATPASRDRKPWDESGSYSQLPHAITSVGGKVFTQPYHPGFYW